MFEYLDIIDEAERIALLTHIPPDGDALGSALATKQWLNQRGKRNVHLYCTDVPEMYAFMPGLHGTSDKYDGSIAYDLCIVLDCAHDRMANQFSGVLQHAKQTLVIDHHMSNDGYGDYNLIDPLASSTAEIIFRLIMASGDPLDAAISTSLYIGLSTDTGNFCYSNTKPETLQTAAALVAAGVDVVEISSKLYKCRSYNKTRLIGAALDSLQLHADGRIATIRLLSEDFSKTGALERDCEGIIEYAREVDGVEVAAMVREIGKNKYKISLRSKHYANVCAVAESFGGGGHERASGCKYVGDLEALMPELIQRLENALS